LFVAQRDVQHLNEFGVCIIRREGMKAIVELFALDSSYARGEHRSTQLLGAR